MKKMILKYIFQWADSNGKGINNFLPIILEWKKYLGYKKQIKKGPLVSFIK